MVSLLACALLGLGQVTIWSSDMTVAQLTTKLGPAYSAAPEVAQRRVAVFVTGQTPKSIAEKVATCLCLQMKGARFVEDPTYSKAVSNYDSQLSQFASDVLKRAIFLARESIPIRDRDGVLTRSIGQESGETLDLRERYLSVTARSLVRSPSVANALTCLGEHEISDVLSGRPVLTNTRSLIANIRAPWNPSDFGFPANVQSGNLAMIVGEQHLALFQYAATKGDPVRKSEGCSLRWNWDEGLAEWTDLGKWTRDWQIREADDPGLALTSLPYDQYIDAGRCLELLATGSMAPLVAEIVPQGKLIRTDKDRVAAFIRHESGWNLLKPARFWRQEELWAVDARVRHWKPVGALDAVSALDWATDLALSGIAPDTYSGLPVTEWFHEGLGYYGHLARLWRSLTISQKQASLRYGITRGTLSDPQKQLFDIAATTSTLSAIPSGDVAGLFERAASNRLKVMSEPVWAHGNGRSSGALFKTRAAMEASLSQNKDDSFRSEGLHFVWRFESEKGFLELENKVLRPISSGR